MPVTPGPVRRAARLPIMLAGAVCLMAVGRPAAAQSFPPYFQKWIGALQSAGFGVTQGSATELSANGGPAGSDGEPPYSRIESLVPIGSEYVDPYYAAPATQIINGVAVNPYFRLSTNEAIITIISLPPQSAYFSYQTNIYSRIASFYPSVQSYTKDPARAAILGSVNNGINNVDMINANTGQQWGTGAVAIITTPNKRLVQKLSRLFVGSSVGGPSAVLFSDPMGAFSVPAGTALMTGLGSSTDDFIGLFRLSVAEDSNAATTWGANAAANILVYRIEAPSGTTLLQFPPVSYLPKSAAVNENTAHTATVNELAGFMQTWLDTQQSTQATITPTTFDLTLSKTGQLESGIWGPSCLATGDVCGGDDQDSDAYKNLTYQNLPAGGSIIVVGVDHTLSGNATYYGFDLQNLQSNNYIEIANQSGPAAGFVSGGLTGSALQAAQDLGFYSSASPQLQADLPNLYVHIFTRLCNPPTPVWCTRAYTQVIPSSALPTNAGVKVNERAYVLPGKRNGANPNDVFNPLVIK